MANSFNSPIGARLCVENHPQHSLPQRMQLKFAYEDLRTFALQQNWAIGWPHIGSLIHNHPIKPYLDAISLAATFDSVPFSHRSLFAFPVRGLDI